MYKTTFESLDVVNEVITALMNRKGEMSELYIKMLENNIYPLETRRYEKRIAALGSAIESMCNSEIVSLIDSEAKRREWK